MLIALAAGQTKSGSQSGAAGGARRPQRSAAMRAPAQEPVVFKNTANDDYAPVPGLLPECFAGAMQRVSRNGGAVVLVRSQDRGCVAPWHWHSSNEQITVVSGTVFIRMRDGRSVELQAGGFAWVPARHVHLFGCSGPCIHFVQSEGPFDIHYVDPTGNEIPLADALRLAEKASAP